MQKHRFAALAVWLILLAGLPLSLAQAPSAVGQSPTQRETAPPAGPSSSPDKSGYISRSVKFRDVELATLARRLKELGVSWTVPGKGRVTAALTVDVPWRHLFTAGDYRLHAVLTSPQIELEGFEFRDLTVAADYADGVLRLDQAKFTLWDPALAEATGTFRGTASLQVSPRGDLTTGLTIDKLNLAELTRLLPSVPHLDGGLVTGSLSARVPYSQIRQLDAWQASGKVSVGGLRFEDLPPVQVATGFQFQRGKLTLDQLSASSGATRVTADAQVTAAAPYSFRVDVRRAAGDLNDLKSLVRKLGVDEQIAGRFAVSGRIEGALEPLAWSAAGAASFADLIFDRIHIDDLRFEVTGDRRRLAITNLRAQLYRGQASGSAVLPLAEEIEGRADIGWSGVQLPGLSHDLSLPREVTAGAASGRVALRIPAGKRADPTAWPVDGTIGIDNAVIDGASLRRLTANFNLRDKSLVVAPLRATMAHGEVLAGARIGIGGSYPAGVNFEVRNLELADFAGMLPKEVGSVAGQVNLTGAAEGTLASRRVTVRGNGALTRAQLRGLNVDTARFGYGLSQYGLALSSLDAQLYGGRLRGQITLPFSALVGAAGDLSWSGIQVGRLATELRIVQQPLAAVSTGTLQARLPPGHNFDLTKLQGAVQLAVNQVTGLGVRDARANLEARIEQGSLAVSRFDVNWPGSRASVSGQIALSQPYAYSARLAATGNLQSLDLKEKLPLGGPLAGTFNLQGNLQGDISPLAATGSGGGTLRDMRLGEASLDSLDFNFTADGKSLRLKQLDGKLYGGSLQGSAVIPIAADAPGEARLTIADLDAGKLAKDIARWPFKLSAVVAASLSAQLPPGSLADPSQWSMQAKVESPSIHINSVLIGDFEADLDVAREKLTINSSGNLLGGKLAARGQWRESADPTPAEANAGLVKLSGLQLSRLARAFPNNRRLQGLAGQLDVSLPFTLPAKFGWPQGQGGLQLARVRWGNKSLVDRLDARVLLQPGVLELNDVSGIVGQGMLHGRAVLNVAHPALSSFAVALENAQVQDLVAAWPELNGIVSGTIDLELRGVLARPWRMRGTLGMSDGRLMGVQLSDVRLPLTVAFEPRSAALELAIPDGAGQLGHGRMQVRLTMHAAQSLSLDLEGRIFDADLQPLLAQAGAAGQLVGGRVDATLTLHGQSIRSLSDLSGSLQARLRNVEPTGLPVFRQMGPYLTGGLSGLGFAEGELRARISGGALVVERMSLGGTGARLYATGRVELSGALDLDVMVSNAQLPGGVFGPALLARLAVGVSSPVGLLIEVNQFLANRVIYLDVSGTVAAPVIRLRPLPLLTNEAARFFLGGGF